MAQSGELIESADLRSYSRGSLLFLVNESQAAITKRKRSLEISGPAGSNRIDFGVSEFR